MPATLPYLAIYIALITLIVLFFWCASPRRDAQTADRLARWWRADGER